MQRLFRKIWPILTILTIVACFFWKVFLLKQVTLPADIIVGTYYPWLDYKWGYPNGVPVKNPITTDVVSLLYPMRILAIDLIKKGQLPLWNPLILAGTPLLGDFQSAPASITNILYFIFDNLTAWSLQIIVQHIFAALFTYLLLRHWKTSKLGSLLGGIIYAFSGFNLIWSQLNILSLSASFIPLLLLLEDKWIVKKELKSIILLSFVLALQILSGYPQVVFYSLIAMGVLWLIRILKTTSRISKSIILIIFLIFGLGISAFQILPGFESLFYSQRGVERNSFESTFLPWSKIITFIAPDYFGNHATGNYWGPQDYNSNTGFVGVIPLVLALISIIYFKKIYKVKIALFILLISLIFAFPTPVSILVWKSGVLGLQAAMAHRSLVLFNFSVALLASFGIDNIAGIRFRYLIKRKSSNLNTFWLVLIIPFSLIIVYGFYALVMFFSDGATHNYLVSLRNLIFPFLILIVAGLLLIVISKLKRFAYFAVILLCFLTTVELFRFGWKFTPFSSRDIVFPKTPVIEYLKDQVEPFRLVGSKVISLNLHMPYALESVEGYEAIYPLRLAQFLGVLNSQNSSASPQGRYGIVDDASSPLLDLVNTKYYLVHVDQSGIVPRFDSNRFKKVFEDKSVVILQSKSVLPRAFMVSNYEVIKSDKEILDALLIKDFPFAKKIILEEDVSELSSLNTDIMRKSTVLYKTYKETESTLSVTAQNDGMLFISDTWFPGWKAYVDRIETKIYRADFAFRAIPIKTGIHDVKLEYRPNSFIDGLKISAMSIICLIIFSLIIGKRTRWNYNN